ncbi:MAG: hypothetical protein KA184_21210 [Candidatus Hydrogenedentes bacterium]|nr:hypothetical protein [Candidatus Hydrogenedentota bacterium]
MTFRGHIKDRAVILNEPAALPGGALLEAPLPDAGNVAFAHRMRPVIGVAPNLPSDMANRHGHHIRMARRDHEQAVRRQPLLLCVSEPDLPADHLKTAVFSPE